MAIPIRVQQVISLPGLGVTEGISFRTISISSANQLVVRGSSDLKIVDLIGGTISKTLAAAADAACLSPNGKILAVRGM